MELIAVAWSVHSKKKLVAEGLSTYETNAVVEKKSREHEHYEARNARDLMMIERPSSREVTNIRPTVIGRNAVQDGTGIESATCCSGVKRKRSSCERIDLQSAAR